MSLEGVGRQEEKLISKPVIENHGHCGNIQPELRSSADISESTDPWLSALKKGAGASLNSMTDTYDDGTEPESRFIMMGTH